MKKIISIPLLIVMLSGCCVFRKPLQSQTVEIVKRDTVLVVRHDSIMITKTVNLYDTLRIETVTGNIVSYIDTGIKKIVTSFTGNIFTVPTTFDTKVITIRETLQAKKPRRFDVIVGVGVVLVMIILALKHD